MVLSNYKYTLYTKGYDTVEEQGYCEHLWELSDQNGFCFIIEYLKVKVIRNFRDPDILFIWLVPHPLIPSSILHYTLKDVYTKFEK